MANLAKKAEVIRQLVDDSFHIPIDMVVTVPHPDNGHLYSILVWHLLTGEEVDTPDTGDEDLRNVLHDLFEVPF